MAVCQLAEGVKEHRFGGGLKPVEQQWVVGQIGELVPKRRANGGVPAGGRCEGAPLWRRAEACGAAVGGGADRGVSGYWVWGCSGGG
ncbi:unnamed protein product [Closterium sp. NIES-54]